MRWFALSSVISMKSFLQVAALGSTGINPLSAAGTDHGDVCVIGSPARLRLAQRDAPGHGSSHRGCIRDPGRGDRHANRDGRRAGHVPADPGRRRHRRDARLAQLTGLRAADQWCCVRPWHPDGCPVIDQVPGLGNAWLTSRHFRTGILMAPVTVQMITRCLSQQAAPRSSGLEQRPVRMRPRETHLLTSRC
jgi:glycine/D-amino acid oxidase-like deaminating enzyme